MCGQETLATWQFLFLRESLTQIIVFFFILQNKTKTKLLKLIPQIQISWTWSNKVKASCHLHINLINQTTLEKTKQTASAPVQNWWFISALKLLHSSFFKESCISGKPTLCYSWNSIKAVRQPRVDGI